MPREQRYFFDIDDLNNVMDSIAARRGCAVAASAEPMTRPDYRAKRRPRPVRVKHERREERRAWEGVE